MSNLLKCADCVFFDPQFKIVQGRPVELWYGLCGKKSVYPHRAQDGQSFPDGCAQAAPDELARPVVVEPGKVVATCLDATRK